MPGSLSKMRIALGVEYDGSRFFGWQRQAHARSVQEDLERALGKVADHPVTVICAGRTDSGVHALGQVVHFDAMNYRSERSWLLGTNANLPQDVSLVWARQASDTFHARFKATARSYRYVILNRKTRLSLLSKKVTWVHRSLDVARMREAAKALEGEHDFTSFRALACQARHPVRTIHAITLTQSGSFIYLDVTANAFLHHMVRNIAGVLISTGRGDKPVAWAGDLLQIRDRRRGGVTALPDGLYLSSVQYPQEFEIPRPRHVVCYG